MPVSEPHRQAKRHRSEPTEEPQQTLDEQSVREEEATVVESGRVFYRAGASLQELEQARRDFEVGVWDRRESSLQRPDGWKTLVCWKLVPPRVPAESKPERANPHFDTAVALCVDQEEAVRAVHVQSKTPAAW
jgi:hypothetical protein